MFAGDKWLLVPYADVKKFFYLFSFLNKKYFSLYEK